VEITGYAKILSVIDPNKQTDLAWYARSGKHSNKSPCEGTGLIGGIHTDGTVEWKKEILFREGYTDGRAKAKVVVDPIIGRWIGWKVVIYNFDNNNNTAVKMESYIDNKDTNYWVQVTNLTDEGGWPVFLAIINQHCPGLGKECILWKIIHIHEFSRYVALSSI
jgi:hypothetical protein